MRKCLKSIGKRFSQAVKSVDLYGQQINLHYKGEDVFKTHFGGTVSIFVILILCGYASYLIQVMFRRETIIYSTNSVIRDLTKDFQDHKPAEHGFAVAIGLRFSDTSLLDDEMLRRYQIRAYQYQAITKPGGEFDETYTELELVSCKDHFPYFNKTLMDYYMIHNYVCIKPTDYSIAGNWYTEVSKSLELEFYKCTVDDRDDCYDDETIYDDIFYEYVEILMINSYFDLNSFDDPIKTYLTQEYFYTYEQDTFVETNIFLKENSISLLDDYTLVDGTKGEKFYTVSDERTDKYTQTSDQFSKISIFLDPETETFNREVFTFMDILANIGGIFSLLQSFAAIIVGFYATQLFQHSVISKLYTFDVDTIDKPRESKIEETQRNVAEGPENIYKTDNLPNIEDQKGDSEEFEGGVRKENSFSDTQQRLSRIESKALVEKLNKKRRYGHSTCDILYGIF